MKPALLLGLALLAALPGRSRAGDGEACRDQAAAAERAAGIPEGLLLAIGRRESGRFDAEAGAVLPWPWTVNRDGEDHIFAAKDEAVAYVAAAQAEGSRSIDVGCFQINLKYHPTAFASLDEGFDPAANAAYAARFLTELHDRDGSWETAVAYYHSATPWYGEPYRDAVLASWHGNAGIPSPAVRLSPGPVGSVLGIRIWVAGASRVAPGPVVLASPSPVVVTKLTRSPGRNWPRVITPSVQIAQIWTGK